MRQVAKLLEDHGVNMVFNGHDHNYQRSLPIRGHCPYRGYSYHHGRFAGG